VSLGMQEAKLGCQNQSIIAIKDEKSIQIADRYIYVYGKHWRNRQNGTCFIKNPRPINFRNIYVK